MHSNVNQLGWRGEPLPRGRHKLTTRAVRTSQRERLLRAMVECVAEYGFESTTVPMVVAAARVSSNAFYAFFEDKADCFLVACDAVAEELLAELVRFESEDDWVHALREGMRLYLQWWQDRPAFSRAYLLSMHSAGERAIDQRERVYAMFRAMFAGLGQRARAEQPELPALDPLVPRALVQMITELVREEVRAGRIGTLCDLEPRLSQLAIKLLADDATARSVLDEPQREARAR